MKKIIYSLALIVMFGCLSACSSIKKTMGIEKTAPDEFLVTSRAPLTLPPEYDLRPVSDGSVMNPAVTNQAEDFSEGEQALLSKLR